MNYKHQEGTWRLTAPDGRTWEADSPIKVVGIEQKERVPAEVRLARIQEAMDEPTEEVKELRRLLTYVVKYSGVDKLLPDGFIEDARNILGDKSSAGAKP